MTDQANKAHAFHALHVSGDPVVLYNIWDAGGAVAIAKAGAHAIATGSYSIAAAHGYPDGEAVPLDFLLQIVERITETVALPVSIDFEGGYATDPIALADNIRKLIRAGAIGLNFEDRIVSGAGLHSIETQVSRIKVIREIAEQEGIKLFINARTDLFLGTDPSTHRSRLDEAIERARAYTTAGASGFFVPGLTDLTMIKEIVDASSLPVNAMMMGDQKEMGPLVEIGIARISYGPAPYFSAMTDLKKRFQGLQ